MTVRVLGVGAAAPGLRLAAAEIGAAWGRGGRGRIAACAPDEDTLTLAWDAGSRAIAAAGLEGGQLDAVVWGTARPPFAEGPSLAFLASALGGTPAIGGFLCSGSPHAGIDALAAGTDAVAAGSARFVLVVASDALRPSLGTSFEARCGAGAVAFVLGAAGGGATIGPRVTRTRPLLDRYRGDGERDTRDLYDARLFREEIFLPAVNEVVDELASFDVRVWSLPDPDGRLGEVIAKRAGAGAPASAAVYEAIGDAGAANALLGGALALDAAGAVAIVGIGGGRTTGLIITADVPVAGAIGIADAIGGGRDASYTEVLRARGQLVPGGETIPMGVPPESAMFARGADEMLRLLGGRCVDCGTISTPPSIHPHCIACGGPKLEPVALARGGQVHTFVVNYTMPAPFVAPLPIAVLDMDDGARLMLQVIGDGTDIEIGRRVELVLRKYAHERGVPVYGFKAKAVRGVVSWNKVAVVGAGLIKMGELFEQSYEKMAAGVFAAAIESVDKGFEPNQVEAAFVATQRGTLWGQEGIGGNTIPTAIGLTGIPCTRIENACPSGSDAFRVGAMAVASGVHDVVLVIGVEKMRDKSTEEGLLSRAAAGHPIFTRGETAPVLFAPFATRHMHEFGTTREMLASVAVKNHYNGARDPYADFQNEITIDDVLKSAPVCHPLHLLDCCPQTDGAAATLLVSAERSSEFTDNPVYVAGFGVATDHPYLHEKDSFTEIKATRLAAERAYAMAGIGPEQVDSAEVHDCFTITEILDIEDLGFFAKGDGGRASLEGETALDGRVPVNTSGGLLAKGHPIGATGVAQVTECWWQLRGEAGERQVEMRNGFALQHNAGGRGSGVSVVNILTNNA